MKALVMDTAFREGRIGLCSDGEMTSEIVIESGKLESQTFVLLMKIGITPDLGGIDLIALAGGPGSFTGLKIGAMVAKSLSFLQKKPFKAAGTLPWVAVSGGKLLGSASLIPHDMDSRMELTPWLASVFVDPELRKQGIGSALVRYVVEEARSRGYQTIYLYTPDRISFYEGLGWTFMERADQKGHPVDIIMIDTG